ncbi:MAG: esterase family protein [Bacteroidales bacterium]|nr:esterase family protein [Bacteroidales bacterium]
MKKSILCWVWVCVAVATAWAQPLRESVLRTKCVPSAILGEDVLVNVYLPAGYDPAAEKLYPSVYLLHGLSDTYTSWEEKGQMKNVVDQLIASGEAARMIVIMPNAGDPDTRNQWNGYFNMPGWRYEDFFFSELIPAMEARFRIQADKAHRAIMGLSMGGGGSTVYSQRHPDMFSSCYAMSAWLDNDEPWSDNPKDKLYMVCQSVHEHSAIDFVKQADEATLAKLRTVKWFIDCGDDDFLLDLSLDLYQEMRRRNVPAELRVRDGWHFWEYWHQALRLALPFATRNFGTQQ